MIKRILFILVSVFVSHLYAQDIKVKVDPLEPVMGESFRVIFEINSKNGTDPIINFDPSGVEVTAREEMGTSTRTTYVNGRLSVSRTVAIAYEMTAPRSGSVYLRNINVELNDKNVKHKNVRVNILRAAKRAKDIFVVADVSKDDVYVGESIVLRYYLYSKVPLTNFDIKKFPKLSKFMKRFHQEQIKSERVRYSGDIYIRRVIYTSQLFVEKPGKVKVDPISLNVFYNNRRNNPFGGFGFNTGRSKKRTVISKSVEINVKQLPLDAIPKSFTGLVGKHDFKIKINKNKFIANEPIEIQLKVKGPGALELLEAPTILSHHGIEEFDTTPDLKVNADFTAEKSFDYTYLGRENLKIPAKKVSFSYFNPETNKYVEKSFELGDIVVAGASAIPVKKDENEKTNKEAVKKTDVIGGDLSGGKSTVSPIAPLYKGLSTFVYSAKSIVSILLALLLLIAFYIISKTLMKTKRKTLTLFQQIYSSGVNYKTLHQALTPLAEGSSMKESVSNSKLNQKTKDYLIDLIEKFNNEYQNGNTEKTIKADKKMFKEVEEILKKANG